MECAEEVFCRIAAADASAANALDASGCEALAAAATLQAASSSGRAAHTRTLFESVMARRSTLAVCDSSGSAGGRAINSCSLRAIHDGDWATSSVEVLVKLPAEALLAH